MQEKNKWLCIVTTAPRKICTLKLTCESLVDCGWTPIVFAEPNSTDLSSTYQTFWNNERLGIWRNWLQATRWGLLKNTSKIITVQDDVDFHPQTKDWLDSFNWPKDTGFISPYTPRPYQTWKDGRLRPIGLNAVKMRSCWTGQSLCFKREVLQALVDNPRADAWTGLPPENMRTKEKRKIYKQKQLEEPWNIQNSDFIIGYILQKCLHKRLYYPNPSLATHCNPVSSVNHGSNTGRRNSLYVVDWSLPIDYQLNPETSPLCQIKQRS